MSKVTSEPFDYGLDARIVGSHTTERVLLSSLFVLLYVTYAGLGRDVFFNHASSLEAANNDPIGAILPYLRVCVCFAIFLVVTTSAGLTWALSKVPLMFVPFWVMALISALWAPEPKDTLRGALMLATISIASPMAIHRLGAVQSVKLSLQVIAAVCISSALLAILVPSIGVHTGTELVQASHVGQWRGIFSHKNGLGPWAAYGSIFCFTHGRRLGGGPAIYWWFAGACGLSCLFFSHSVTSQIMFCYLLYATLILYLLKRQNTFELFIYGFVIPGFIVITLGSLQETIFEILGRDTTLTGRTELWALAQTYFWDAPLLGHGFISAGGTDFLSKVFEVSGQALGAESAYWTLLLELGAIGFLLFMVPLAIALRNGFQWLKYVHDEDRRALEFYLVLLSSTLVLAYTDASSLAATSFDGIIAFSAFYALLTTPKSPLAMAGDQRHLSRR